MSPDRTTVLPNAGSITDSAGNVWRINTEVLRGSSIVARGLVAPASLAIVGGQVWANTADGMWHNLTTTSVKPTKTSPLSTESHDGMTVNGPGDSIIDAAGNILTINAARQVVINGKPDTNTSAVTALLYTNHTAFQTSPNASKFGTPGWWAFTPPASWADVPNPQVVIPPVTPPGPPPPITPPSGANLSMDPHVTTAQSISPNVYGIGTGALLDDQCDACTYSGVQAALAAISPPLLRLNSASGHGPRAPNNETFWGSSIFAGGAGSPDWSYIDPFLDNAAKFLAPSTTLVVGVADHMNNNISPQELAARAVALANHFKAKGHEAFLWEVWNEPNGVIPDNQYFSWFNAVADALHGVNSAYLVGGPVHSYVAGFPDGGLINWGNTCGSRAGFCDFHAYGFANYDDPGLFAATNWSDQADVARRSLASTPAANVPLFMGEWNINGTADDPRGQQIQGAVFNALTLARCIKANNGFTMAANWEAWGDGSYGVINDPASKNGGFGYGIYPAGYLLGYAGKVMGGSMSPVTLPPGTEGYATVSNGKFAIQIINPTGSIIPVNPSVKGATSMATYAINGNATPSINPYDGKTFNMQPTSILFITGTYS